MERFIKYKVGKIIPAELKMRFSKHFINIILLLKRSVFKFEKKSLL